MSYYENIGIPKIIGVRNHIVELGSDALDLMEGIAFDDDTGYVDSGYSGEVNYSREGYYEVEYYVEDDDGNYITESSFVLVGSSFDYYEKLVPKLVTMSSSEKGYIRDYALLYSAAKYLTNNTSSFERYIDNIGNFVTPKNYENLLGRTLRADESNTILNYGNILRKIDKEVYQIIKGSPISSIEEDHFENAYEIYRIASEDVYLTNGDYSLEVTDLNDFTLFEKYEGEKLATMMNSIEFYREYSNLGYDDDLIEVISETSYTFNSNLLKLNEIPFPGRFVYVFCHQGAETVCPLSKLLNLNSYAEEVLRYRDDLNYGEAYMSYQIHKDALAMYKDLLLLGEESNLELIENALIILFDAIDTKNTELHYKLNNNVFDNDEIEIGMGIHGEPGIKREKLKKADILVNDLCEIIFKDFELLSKDKVSIMINSLGATPLEELYIVSKRVNEIFSKLEIDIVKSYVGRYATSLEMAGMSITVLKLNNDLSKALLDHSECPFWIN